MSSSQFNSKPPLEEGASASTSPPPMTNGDSASPRTNQEQKKTKQWIEQQLEKKRQAAAFGTDPGASFQGPPAPMASQDPPVRKASSSSQISNTEKPKIVSGGDGKFNGHGHPDWRNRKRSQDTDGGDYYYQNPKSENGSHLRGGYRGHRGGRGGSRFARNSGSHPSWRGGGRGVPKGHSFDVGGDYDNAMNERGRGGQRGSGRGSRGYRGQGPTSHRGGKFPSKGDLWDELFANDIPSSSEATATSGVSVSSSGSGNVSDQDHDPDYDDSNLDDETNSLLARLKAYEARRNEEIIAARRNAAPHTQLQKTLEFSDHQKSLPIYHQKDELMKLVNENQVLIVQGETGSGKSTQIPQYLVKEGFARIVITQPRRIAASSLAERVAQELNERLGGKVGYAVRFEKKVSSQTVIKYVTDGYLLKECSSKPEVLFDGYSVVIIDEAHERSLHTDIILGLAKRAIQQRKDLKVIVSSATLDYEKLSKFFDNAPVFNISGRCYDVEIIHEPERPEVEEDESDSEIDYLKRVAEIITEIHLNQDPGDVLVFLPGKEEIDDVKRRLEGESDMIIRICHSSLPFEEQKQIHDPPPSGQRKIVLATNIAETSITINGIVYVVDSGYFKQNIYDRIHQIFRLDEKPITKCQAIQRQGRAGRTRTGKCYRVYTKSKFDKFDEEPIPEIKRENLESVVLQLLKLGVKDPFSDFDYIDKDDEDALADIDKDDEDALEDIDKDDGDEDDTPKEKKSDPISDGICDAMFRLADLSALDSTFKLTDLGRRMAELPVEPPLAKAILESVNLGCEQEVCIIAALLSGSQHRNLFVSSDFDKAHQTKIQRKFDDPDGDHLSLLKMYRDWETKKSQEDKNKWCAEHYISRRYLVEVESITKQLLGILESFKNNGAGANNTNANRETDRVKLSENIRKAFTAGYFRQIAAKAGIRNGRHYIPLLAKMNILSQDEHVILHESSSLNRRRESEMPEWVIFHEISKNKNKKAMMRDVSVIEISWFKEYGRRLYDKLQRMSGEASQS